MKKRKIKIMNYLAKTQNYLKMLDRKKIQIFYNINLKKKLIIMNKIRIKKCQRMVMMLKVKNF